MTLMAELGWTPEVIDNMHFGKLMAVYGHLKAKEYNDYMLEEDRTRRLALYASSWLDNSNKSYTDMWTCPWDGKPDKVVVPTDDEALAKLLEARRRIEAKKDATKKGHTGQSGPGHTGLRQEDGGSERQAQEADQRLTEGGPETIDSQ